jgi:hypothetical protein
MISVCSCHPAPPSADQHRWKITGEFIDVLSFLCEVVLNRQHGTEMLLHSQNMYETDDGVAFHFTANWGPEQMRSVLALMCSHHLILMDKLIYLGTPTHPTFAYLSNPPAE